MTNYPTLLGTDGHGASNQSYSGTYYSNVGLGRCPMMVGGFTTESYVSQPIRVPGNISYLSWGLDTAFGATLTLTLNKNSSSSTLAVSVGGEITGWVTDSSDSVSVLSGDTLDFAASVESGQTVSYSGGFCCVSARFDSTDNTIASAQMIVAVGPTDAITPTTTQMFLNFLGILGSSGVSTESTVQSYCLVAGTWQNMACHVESNSFSLTTTVNNRITRNNVSNNGSMLISIPACTSGYFEDTSHSDSLDVGDLLDYGFISLETAGTGSVKFDWIGAHFIATDATRSMIGGSAGGRHFISDTEHSSLFGGQIPSSPTTRATGLLPYASTASAFTNYVFQPAGTITYALLKNGTSALSVTSGGSGYIMDNTHTVTFAVGDTCADQIAPEVSSSVYWANAGLLLQSS